MAKKRAPKGRSSSPGRTARDPGAQRRRRLLAQLQGRRLDEAYLNHPDIRADLEAEAADPGPDALVTPGALEHLRALIREERRVIALGPAPERARGIAAGAAAAVGDPGRVVLDALSQDAAAERSVAAPQAAAGEAGGIEVFARPRLFFSTDTVVVVPGFLASALSDTIGGGLGLIWVDPLLSVRDELGALQLGPYDGRERDLDPNVRVGALGALPYFYDILRLDLEVRRYTVEVFPVDWRRDLDVAAGMLAARLRALAGQARTPIHVVAHSQGALVARRAAQLLGRTEARRIVKHLVLLGPANYGSFSAAFALAGNHSLLPMVRRLAVEPRRGFQAVLASMTGIYQLLPSDRDRIPWLAANDYSQPGFWRTPVDATRLARFYGWNRWIDSSFLNDRTAVILGDNHGAPTTGGVVFRGALLQDAPAHGLAGDGTVPHSCAVLPGTRAYLAPGTEHSQLATYRSVIDAVRDVLADRPVAGLREVSSNPADHLTPVVGAARGLAAPGVRGGPGPDDEGARPARAPRRPRREAEPE